MNIEHKIEHPRNLVKTNIEDITKNIKVIKADTDLVEDFIKDVCAVDDIKNKIILVRMTYPVDEAVIKKVQNSLFAINEVLHENNSAFVVLPDDEHVTEVNIKQIDGVIRVLEKLKEKIKNEDNSDAGLQTSEDKSGE